MTKEVIKIIKILEDEVDWIEMHKIESKFESGKVHGLGRAIDIIKKLK